MRNIFSLGKFGAIGVEWDGGSVLIHVEEILDMAQPPVDSGLVFGHELLTSRKFRFEKAKRLCEKKDRARKVDQTSN